MKTTSPNAGHFTVSHIGKALGRKRQIVQRALDSVAPSGEVVVQGVPVNAWSIAALPAPLQVVLTVKAEQLGYRNAQHLLSAPAPQWQPPLPLAEIAPHCLEAAAKLQRALARPLARRNDRHLTSADLEQIGLAEYQAEFGHAITARHWRGLFKRTIERDGGAEQFNRLELYLGQRPARQTALPSAPAAGTAADFPELRAVLATFKNPALPAEKEMEYLWLRAGELYAELIAAGQPAKKARRALARFLYCVAPGLSKNESALRKMLGRKLERTERGESLADRRAENSGNYRGPELSAQDRDAIVAHARFNCGGRVVQAWRELGERGGLSEALLSYYRSNPGSKSYCPPRIRAAVTAEIRLLDDLHHGPRAAKLNGAWLDRDWSGVASMDWIQADDVTAEVYFYIPDGAGWFTLTRGQLLLFIDLRSTRILGYALLPEKSYNARAIRTAITKVCDDYGLPRKGFYFEKGIWKDSALLRGDPNAGIESWGVAEMGLLELGLDFQYADLPRAKPVERVIGAIQDLMDGLPGFVGGNEMKEKFERVQAAKQAVERSRNKPPAEQVHPSKHFLDADQWDDCLRELCERYNAARQDGKMCAGQSPNETFERCQNHADPLIKLPAAARYLLAHHRRPIKVTANGVTLRFGKQSYNYRNAETGKLIGQTVLAWFNPELPEILTITDMDRSNPFSVERSQSIPAMDATREQIEQEMARIKAHGEYTRTRYRTLKALVKPTFRPVLANRETLDLGRQIATQQAELRAGAEIDRRNATRANKAARRLGMVMTTEAARRPETAAAAERLAKMLAEIEAPL